MINLSRPASENRLLLRSIAAVLSIAAILNLSAARPLQAAARKPNFLFVYTDDQRWDAMGVVQREQGEQGRFPFLETPNMDRLASEGVRFRNAFVTLPLCAPSRAAFLTGRYNHLNGVANNHTPFPEESVTYASLLKSAEYATGYIGKWHMGRQRGKRPGFDYSASFVGQGRYVDCPFEINGVHTPTSGWVDDVSTDYAITFLEQHRNEPFALVVGFKTCHGPFQPPERAAERFAGGHARSVPNLDIRAIYSSGDERPPRRSRRAGRHGGGNSNINLNYFRCISAADDNLGRLLDALDELDLADDTMVVFTSDNGYYLGEHGLGDKRSAYDESLRIPLLVRYPKQFLRTAAPKELVLSIDLAPTILDAAGVTIPPEMQGRSLAPLLTGKATDWRRAFLAEYFRENAFPQTPTLVAVRTETAKLITYPGHDEWIELFDLASDPYETKNLVAEPKSKKLLAEMQKELQRQIESTGYETPEYVDKPKQAVNHNAEKAAGQ
jgi:arylsulfatase A-like enzyme